MILSFLTKLFQSDKKSSTSNSQTIGSLQNKPIAEWGNKNIINSLEFSATLQLRTPLEVLKRHGEIFSGHGAPPQYAKEEWHGIWLPKTKTFRELGIDVNEMDEGSCASDAGSVKASEYLPFLLKFREIVEKTLSVDEKIVSLEHLSKQDENFKVFWNKHKAIDADFPHSFFYKQLATIDGIGHKMAKALYENGFKSVSEIQNATDEELLSVKGVGKSLLVKIRLN
ncbi:MAG: helix-hairpin-helix domain-containing protein [Sulfuricurvum sp.]|nr:MAG: hypothetical protein B7Y17_02390 [Sulfuricurvum sp. 24-42-5]